jgi:4-amino-4-deoxy-L-arabinose transferase-like glycosyltransferase
VRALPYAPVLLAFLLVVLFQMPLIHEPMQNDEGVYFTVAASGDLPYVSAFDHKPPIIYGWYRLALLLNGGVASVELVHAMAAVLMALTAVTIYATGRAMAGHRLGVLAALAFGLFTADQYLQFNANTEAFGLLPLSLSLLAFVIGWRRGGTGWFALAGVFGAVATLTKTSMAFNLLALLAFLAWMGAERERSWKRVAVAAVALVGGAGAIACFTVLPWVVAGHFDQFWFANVTYNLKYTGALGAARVLDVVAEVKIATLMGGLVLWALATVGSVAGHLPGRMKLLTLLWLAGSFVGIAWTGRQSQHYYVQLLPGAALLAGAGLAWFASRWSERRFRLHTYAVMGPATALMLISLSFVYLPSTDAAHLRKWEGSEYAKRNVAADIVAKRVAALTTEGDTIYNLGWESQLYALTGRTPAARVFRIANVEVAPELLDEVLADLEASPPALIVDTTFEIDSGGERHDMLPRPVEEAFSSFIRSRYEFVETVEFADIYRLRTRVGTH